MQRIVKPEILDELDPSDPIALRSRNDLRLINGFMRGEGWILSELAELDFQRVIELGAGEGVLANKIQNQFPEKEVVALDFIKKPELVSEGVRWIEGDLLEYEHFSEGDVVVANLFLHHLQDEQLMQLGEKLSKVKAVLFAEPHRAQTPKIMGRCLYPLINEVTRHDMMVSIEAGFRRGELGDLLREGFHWEESLSVFGGIRVKGVRR